MMTEYYLAKLASTGRAEFLLIARLLQEGTPEATAVANRLGQVFLRYAARVQTFGGSASYSIVWNPATRELYHYGPGRAH